MFQYAVDTGQLGLANDIAGRFKSPALLDSCALERYRRGDEAALQGYPRGEMTFSSAWQLAHLLVQMDQFDRAEKFVTGIKSTVGNSPEEVAGLTFKLIAMRCREKGDLELAKRYIDKAVAAAGDRGYTGYAIQVGHRSIHGKLLRDLDAFAQLGAQFPAHMGRELIENLNRELVLAGHDDAAKLAAAKLDRTEDVQNCLTSIAVHQAERGDLEAAVRTVAELNGTATRDTARLRIADALYKAGQAASAKKFADMVLRRLGDDPARDVVLGKLLASLYARLRCQAELQQLFAQAKSPQLKTDRVLRAMSALSLAMLAPAQG